MSIVTRDERLGLIRRIHPWVILIVGLSVGVTVGLIRTYWQLRPGQPRESWVTVAAFFVSRFAFFGLIASLVAIAVVLLMRRGRRK